MGSSVIKTIDRANREYYDATDVQELLGVSQDKAYKMIREPIKKMKEKGLMGDAWEGGKIPKWLFRKYYMLDECAI